MAVFFISGQARLCNMEGAVAQIVETSGFELVRKVESDQGFPAGYEVDGASPLAMPVAFDALAVHTEHDDQRGSEHCDNAHVHEFERRLREYVESQTPPDQRPQAALAIRNSSEAWSIIGQCLPDDEAALRQLAEIRAAAMVTEFEVVRDLTRLGSRAKVELIRYGDGLAIKKTFRHSCLRFMEREGDFMERFSKERREIPPVLERGPNFLIMPFVEARPLRRTLLGRTFPRLMSVKQVRDTADLIRYLCAHGYDPVDFGPHNLLVDKAGKITAIDHEFMHRADGPIDPERSACLAGIGPGFDGEWPPKARWAPHRAKCLDPWRLRWFGATGLTLRSFLYDPPWLQQLKRAVNYPLYLAGKLAARRHGAPQPRFSNSIPPACKALEAE